jgi:uncharacterized protein (TIGR03000 family)
MMSRRCFWALLAVSVSLFAVSDLFAWGRRGPAVIQSPDYYYPPFYGNAYPMTYGFPYNTPYGVPDAIPYVAPYPYYGVLPPAFAAMQRYYGYNSGQATGIDSRVGTLDYEPRRRSTQYPAVPFGASTEDRQTDLTRARFEINVPVADAVVLFDGVKMTQTGLQRIFLTPPLVEGKIYSATFEVQWTAEDGARLTRKKSFDFVIGERLAHTFIE